MGAQNQALSLANSSYIPSPIACLVIKSGNFKEPNPQSGSFISGDLPFGGGYFAKGKWEEKKLTNKYSNSNI
jgi:hypothetical protein